MKWKQASSAPRYKVFTFWPRDSKQNACSLISRFVSNTTGTYISTSCIIIYQANFVGVQIRTLTCI